jgi:prepilin-type N-terminal cleavage/methylation domain-containing protein
MNRSCLKSCCGFTLAELMVSVGVVLVLLAVAVPTASKYHKLARKVECQASIIHYLRAQELYYLDHNTFYTKGSVNQYYYIAWNKTNRPDLPDKYVFFTPTGEKGALLTDSGGLGVEFRRDSHRGYRILVKDIHQPGRFDQELELELTTDEDFDGDGSDDYYLYDKHNWQRTGRRGRTSGSFGDWWVNNQFWFEIQGVPAYCCFPRTICGCSLH